MGNRPFAPSPLGFSSAPVRVVFTSQTVFQTNPVFKTLCQVLGKKPSVFLTAITERSPHTIRVVSQTEPDQEKKKGGYQARLHARLRSSVQRHKQKKQKKCVEDA